MHIELCYQINDLSICLKEFLINCLFTFTGMILGPSDVLRITSSLAGMGNDSLDNQHLEYEQFFVMQTSDERDDNNKDQISSDHSTKLLRVMAEHKSLLQKVNKTVKWCPEF